MSGANIPFVVSSAAPLMLSTPNDEFRATAFRRVQSELLSDVLVPVLNRLHPDDDYFVGIETDICWRYTKPDLLAGYKSPAWCYVPGVPRLQDGRARSSYVLWEEVFRPLIVAEYVSGSGFEERDATPFTGAFWIYERGISAVSYVIWDVPQSRLEVYEQKGGRYRPQLPDADGRFWVPEMEVNLGIWHGNYQGYAAHWLRAWDCRGRLLPTPQERAERPREPGAGSDTVGTQSAFGPIAPFATTDRC